MKAQQRLAAFQDRAVSRLFELVEQSQFPSTALSAVKDVLDRTLGRPTETVDVSHKGQAPRTQLVVIIEAPPKSTP